MTASSPTLAPSPPAMTASSRAVLPPLFAFAGDESLLAGRSLEVLRKAGGFFYLDRGGDLVLDAPVGLLTPGVKGIISSRKEAMEDYLKHEPREPVAVRCAHLNGDIIWRAGDTCPIPPIHLGRVVYRTSELPILRGYSPAALAALHVDKRRLLSVWKGAGWIPTRPRFDDNKRRRPGFEVTLEDLARSANMATAAASRLVDYLCRAGICVAWAPGGEECLRLIPPEERWKARYGRFDPTDADRDTSPGSSGSGIEDFDFDD